MYLVNKILTYRAGIRIWPTAYVNGNFFDRSYPMEVKEKIFLNIFYYRQKYVNTRIGAKRNLFLLFRIFSHFITFLK